LTLLISVSAALFLIRVQCFPLALWDEESRRLVRFREAMAA
jgi:hypothetical protein